MAATEEKRQTIARLTPLADAIAALDALASPVAARMVAPADAVSRILAADIKATPQPARPIALRDGFAVHADDTADASSYAPVRLPKAPVRVEAGDDMPPGTDCVAPVETIVMQARGAEVIGALVAGEGVLPAGGDFAADRTLRRTGQRVRRSHVAVFAAAGIKQVSIREPRITILAARDDARLTPALELIAGDIESRGGSVRRQMAGDLDRALRDGNADAHIIIGGSGNGLRDQSVTALARAGKVTCHGVGLSPGDTAALGSAGGRPALVVPGRLDAAMAVWLTLGRRSLSRLAGGGNDDEAAVMLTLSRKVTSTVGMAEFVPITRCAAGADPLGARPLPLSALARADGWLLVPPESEGYAAGAQVAINAWP